MHGYKNLQKTKKAVRVFRPALLPDNRSLVWYPLAICGVLATLGYALGSFAFAIIPLLAVALFPGLPIAIHSLYFLSVRITVCGDTLNVVDWAGDPFVRYPRRQEIDCTILELTRTFVETGETVEHLSAADRAVLDK